MVIWVLFTHIKNIFNGSIMTSPRPKYGEALVAGGLAYSSDLVSSIYYFNWVSSLTPYVCSKLVWLFSGDGCYPMVLSLSLSPLNLERY